MKKIYILSTIIFCSMHSFSQKDPCGDIQSKNNDKVLNKKIAIALVDQFEIENKQSVLVGTHGTYLRHSITYNQWDVHKDELGNITGRSINIVVIYKNKKGICGTSVDGFIIQDYMGGGTYGEPYSSGIRAGYVIKKIDCDCINELTDWLNGETTNNSKNNSGNETKVNKTKTNQDNKPRSENTSSSIKDGPYETKFDNGTVREKGAYLAGKKTGTWTEFEENGNMKQEASYKDGELNGKFTSYVDSKKRYDWNYVNGKREGEQRNYSDKGLYNLKEIIILKNDQKEGVCKYYDENGNLKSEETYKAGQKDGLSTRYRDNSKIKAEDQMYVNGKKEGAYTHYDKLGKMEEKGQYANNEKDGRWEEFDNGKLKAVKNFKKGQMDGTQEWHVAGKVTKTEIWENGVKIQ